MKTLQVVKIDSHDLREFLRNQRQAELKEDPLGAARGVWNALLIMAVVVVIGLAVWWIWGWAGKLMG